ncbi:MAG: dihydropteroate synthase [Burkholderiales bacterium]|nr:dihydropteroate synthase [Burkholderiales bacterium]
MPTMLLRGYRLPSDRPAVMGIVNVTPDSFADGGRYLEPAAAIAHARELVAEGADILDIGAESTRPGATPVSADEELARLLPLLEAVLGLGVPVSVDTMKPQVMHAVAARGAAMLNDVRGFRDAEAFAAAVAAARQGVGLAIMHMAGEPRTMQAAPSYADVNAEVDAWLAERVAAFVAAGVAPAQICIDPGFGFGKNLQHNLALLRGLERLTRHGVPVLAGLSRKSMLGALTGRSDPGQRLAASLAGALIAVKNGATILRVHDVAATRDALAVWCATRTADE